MEQIRKRLWLALDNLRNFSSIEDAILWVAALLYLRKNNALFLDTRSEKIIEEENKGLDVLLMLSLPGGRRLFCDRCALSCQNDISTLLRKYIGVIRNGDIVRNIVEFVMDLNNNELSEIDFLSILDWTIEYGSTTNKIQHQPHEISVLVDRLLDSKVKTVFDPFGGLMDFATTMRNRCFVANEINSTIWKIGLFRLALAGVIDHTIFNNCSSEDWTCEKRFDAIITLPPFGAKLRLPDSNSGLKVKAEEVALRYFGSLTSPVGQLISIVPLSLLGVETLSKNLRKEITDNNWLDAIVYLPLDTFSNAAILTAMVVLNKNRNSKDPIRIVDATDCYIKNNRAKSIDVDAIIALYDNCNDTITQAEIIEQNYTWELRWYLDQQKSVFNEGYETVMVKDILTQISSFNKFEDTRGEIVGIKDLANDVYNYEKRPEDFSIDDDLRQTSKITEPVILLSMIREPRPTYCKASEQNPIFVKRNVCAYRITNDKIHPGYLCLELSKRLKAYKGALMPGFSKGQILNTLIEFPSLNEQRSFIEQMNVFEESRHTALAYKAKELGIEALLEQKKKEYIDEVRHRKHDMKTPMTQLRNTLTLLENLVCNASGEISEKLELYVKRQKKAMDTLSEIVSHIADEDAFATPEPIDLCGILSSFQTKTEKYVVAFNPDNTALAELGSESPMVNMGRSDLLRLVQNIVENAIKRGFISDYSKYVLNINLTIKDSCFFIDFSNNGEPLPIGLDKERYGTKGEKGINSDGSGTGGYVVKSIVNHYGGDYDIYSEQFAGTWLTHVIIKLPIYQDYE